MQPIIYLIIRLAIATSMLTHGLVRIPKIAAFAEGMTKDFEKSILPLPLVRALGYAIPVAELVIGLLLLIGLFTRTTAVAGGFLMIVLLFGSGMTANWGAMPSQLLHTLFFALLIQFSNSNKWALDKHP